MKLSVSTACASAFTLVSAGAEKVVVDSAVARGKLERVYNRQVPTTLCTKQHTHNWNISFSTKGTLTLGILCTRILSTRKMVGDVQDGEWMAVVSMGSDKRDTQVDVQSRGSP